MLSVESCSAIVALQGTNLLTVEVGMPETGAIYQEKHQKENGSRGRTRTYNPLVNSQLLYH